MKTIEELKGMTQDDLICLVQELQEQVEKTKKDSMDWFRRYQDVTDKFNGFKNLINGILTLSEQLWKVKLFTQKWPIFLKKQRP